MAEEHKKHKKHKPRTIITHRHDDGSYSHEHAHDGAKHNAFAGTSSSLEDVKQHMEDHFGGPEEAAEPPAEAAAEMPGE